MPDNVKAGDDVEVAFTSHDGPIFNPGTVVLVDGPLVIIRCADGVERSFGVDSGSWRIPKATPRPIAVHQSIRDKMTRG